MKNLVFSGAVARLAIAAVGTLWFALLAGYAGTWWWPLDLFSHFRVQYAVLFVLLAAVLLEMRSWTAGGAAALGGLICAATVLAHTGLFPGSVAASQERVRFVTFNAHYGNRSVEAIADYLGEIDADAVVLLELDAQRVHEIARRMPSQPHVYAKFSHPHYGAGILSRWPILHAEGIELTPGGSRAVRATIEIRGQPVDIVGAHLHWPLGRRNATLRNAELMAIAQLAASEDGPLLIGGDFNVTPWSRHFQRMLAASKLEDCARGRGWLPTWPSFFPPLGIRIDHCLASPHWRVLDVRTGPALGSDHYATINDLELAREPLAIPLGARATSNGEPHRHRDVPAAAGGERRAKVTSFALRHSARAGCPSRCLPINLRGCCVG